MIAVICKKCGEFVSAAKSSEGEFFCPSCSHEIMLYQTKLVEVKLNKETKNADIHQSDSTAVPGSSV